MSQGGNIMKRVLLTLLVMLLVLGIFGCGNDDRSTPTETTSESEHIHTYSDATCTDPQKCSCGATNGSVLGHNYSGKICTRCGESAPNYTELAEPQHTHSYSDATCTAPQKCSCGATTGSALGHNYSGKSCTRCGASDPNYTEQVKPQHTHAYSNATCTAPQKCSCGATKGSALGHNYSGKTCTRCGASNPNYTEPVKPQHTHAYFSSVTKESTCAENGVRTYKCSCGHSYTEPIEKKTYHNWEYATCASPKKCKVCGITEGNPLEHDYRSYDGYKCSKCGKVDPTVQSTLDQCSLQLPTLPKAINYYSYSGKLQSQVNVTQITYKFEYYDNGNVILTAKFAGTKTYDTKGAGQSSECRIGWKLYDPDGNVFRAGTFFSPSVAMGESFVNQEEDLIYNFEAAKPGKYRLEILDVN